MNLNTTDVYVLTSTDRSPAGWGTFEVGDRVRLATTEPDSDGDLYARAVDGSRTGHVFPSSIRPEIGGGVVQISAVRAALVALGIEADVVAVAQAIEAATAKEAE